jgi:predicted amidophosphoribosyltransferase
MRYGSEAENQLLARTDGRNVMAINPTKLEGVWYDGYAIDYHIVHSEFMGYDDRGHPKFDTKRTKLGELLFLLKYRSDMSVLKKIVKVSCDFIEAWKIKPDCLISVPPSRGRRVQPVIEIVKGIGANLKIDVCDKTIAKVKDTPELKNISDYSERRKMLKGAYDVRDSSLKGKSVLVIDDLYRSGATLNALTDVLNKKGKVQKVYVLALTRARGAL